MKMEIYFYMFFVYVCDVMENYFICINTVVILLWGMDYVHALILYFYDISLLYIIAYNLFIF